VFPILLLIVFAIIDFGRMLNTQLNATEAAREGTRVAAFGGDPTGRVDMIAGEDATVETVSCPAEGALEEDTQVTVIYPGECMTPFAARAGLFGADGSGGDVPLTGRGVMPCQ